MQTPRRVEQFQSISGALTGIIEAARPAQVAEPVDYSDWTRTRLQAHAETRGIDLFRRQKYRDDILAAIVEADAAAAEQVVDADAVTAAIAVGEAVLDGMTLAAARARVAAAGA